MAFGMQLADERSSFMAFLEEKLKTKAPFKVKPVPAKELTMDDLETQQDHVFSENSKTYAPNKDVFEVTDCVDEPTVSLLRLKRALVYKYQWDSNSSLDDNMPIQEFIITAGPIAGFGNNLNKAATIDLLEKAAIVFANSNGDKITGKESAKISITPVAICVLSRNGTFNTQKIEYYFIHENKLLIVGTMHRLYDNETNLIKAIHKTRMTSQTTAFVEKIKLCSAGKTDLLTKLNAPEVPAEQIQSAIKQGGTVNAFDNESFKGTAEASADSQAFLSQIPMDDFFQLYCYLRGQAFAIEKIKTDFPDLIKDLKQAERLFQKSFHPSLAVLNKAFPENDKAIIEFNKKFDIEMQNSFPTATRLTATDFIAELVRRSKGDIPSPFCETLLCLNPEYDESPEKEFLAGYKKRFTTDGSGKSKGIAFHIDYPKSWQAKDGYRPNVIQNLRSKKGHGPAMVLFMIRLAPDGEDFSKLDVDELCNKEYVQNFIPGDGDLIKFGKLKLEGLPGIFFESKSIEERMGQAFCSRGITYIFFHANAMIMIMNQVAFPQGDKEPEMEFEKNRRLFHQIVNSFVLLGRYSSD